MKITLLGTGTPNPSLKRAGSGYLVQTGSLGIVLDHGPGAHQRLLETGTPATGITHIFFSHLHYDHCLDYARLVLTRWDQGFGKIAELGVFGPAPIRRMTDQLFGEDGVFGPDIDARIHHPASIETFVSRGGTPPRQRPAPLVRELTAGDEVHLDGARITVAEVPHVQPYLACLAYRIETSEGVLVYSGDSGPSEDLTRLARGADVLILMCHHVSGTSVGADWMRGACGHLEAAKIAQDAGVGSLVLTHLPGQFDLPGIRERVVSEVANAFAGHVFLGEDLLQVPLKGPQLRKHDG